MPFVKGVSGNPNGRPRNAESELLREALRKQGEKRGQDFWEKVAEYAYTDKNVMIAVLKKFVPDSNITTVEGELRTVMSMDNIKKDDKPLNFKIGDKVE